MLSHQKVNNSILFLTKKVDNILAEKVKIIEGYH